MPSLPSSQFSHLLINEKHKHISRCYCHSHWGLRNEKLRVFFLRASGPVRVGERKRVETSIKIRNCYSVQEKPQQTKTQLLTGDNTDPRFSATKPVSNHLNVHSEVAICWAWLNMHDCFIMKYFRHKKTTQVQWTTLYQLKVEDPTAFSFLSSGNPTPEFGTFHSLLYFYTFITCVHIYKWCVALFHMFSNLILLNTTCMYHPTNFFGFVQHCIFEKYLYWCLEL